VAEVFRSIGVMMVVAIKWKRRWKIRKTTYTIDSKFDKNSRI